jgi:hypothetical protein
MWIPHRVFFGNLAILAALATGLVLLVWRVRSRTAVAAAIVGPAAVAGGFLGLTATRGIPWTWPERAEIAARVTGVLSLWLLGADGMVLLLRRQGAPRVVQAATGALTLAAIYAAARAILG